MNLSGISVADLFFISNLTFFLDRLITDGRYQTVQLIYDDAYLNDNDFVAQLATRAVDKYAMLVEKCMWRRDPLKELKRNNNFMKGRIDSIRIMKLNYGEQNSEYFEEFLGAIPYLMDSVYQNLVLLIPAQSNNRKLQFWKQLKEYKLIPLNISVVFYQTEESSAMARATREPIEIYAVNYKVERSDFALNFQHTLDDEDMNHLNETNPEFFLESVVDEENSLYRGQLNETNMHEAVFGMISKKIVLSISTVSDILKSVPKTAQMNGNPLVDFGSSDCYLSNFIARNLKFKDAEIHLTFHTHQRLLEKRTGRRIRHNENIIPYGVSSERIYAELYNEVLPENGHKRSVDIDVNRA